ncbi:MAG: dTMP kinase [Solirubrobacterales bacterium]
MASSDMTFGEQLAVRLDAVCDGVALIFGSVPPRGRDLDLLVAEPEGEAVAEALRDTGWVSQGHQWACFQGSAAFGVDLIPATSWELPDDELRTLFDQAVALPRLENLRRPSPHHALLILAERTVRGDGRLPDRHRVRIGEMAAEDPGVWRKARDHAPAWSATAALELLAAAYAGDGRVPLAARAAGLAEILTRYGIDPLRARAHALRAAVAPQTTGAVITFSGLDGAGKSSQAEALRDAMEALGADPVIVWTALGAHPGLDRLIAPVKGLLRAASRLGLRPSPTGPEPVLATDDPGPVDREGAELGRGLRERSRLLASVWLAVLGVANGVSQRRATRAHVRRGRLVICDRWTLDSSAHLRYAYGPDSRMRVPVALIRAISPRPLRSWLLDISPETAYARKGEYPLEEFRRQANLYREQADTLGVERVDGERPAAQLSEQLARETWLAL